MGNTNHVKSGVWAGGLACEGLSTRQKQLIELIRRKTKHGVPAVQRDLAEAMGIRRDSLNKLLARTRRLLTAAGLEIQMPSRSRDIQVGVGSLSVWE